jgi:hypothetical protein
VIQSFLRPSANWRAEGTQFAVKKQRFSVEQIAAVPEQIELGLTVADATRQVGISEPAIYRWNKAVRRLRVRPDAGAQAAA